MTVDEDRMHLRTRLEELVGVSGADILLDRPPGGWNDLVTNHSLDLRFAASEERFDRKLETLGSRMEARFGVVDARFRELEHRLDLRFAEVDVRFAEIEHRLDRFEDRLLAQVDRRLRSQAWVTISTVIAAMGVIVAAIRI